MDKENKPTWEQFKEELLRWKNAHTEEYNRFTRAMQSCDAVGFIKFYRKITDSMPKLDGQWRRVWDNENLAELDDMVLSLRESDLPENLLREYSEEKDKPVEDRASLGHTVMNIIRRISGKKSVPTVNLSSPMVMSWLVYGRSFETMYEILVSQMKMAGVDFKDRESCLQVSRTLIQSSINSRYRTRDDWEDYFRRRKAISSGEAGNWIMEEMEKEFISPQTEEVPSVDIIPPPAVAEKQGVIEEPGVTEEPKPSGRRKAETKPLVEYLSCGNKDAVIDIIREHIKANNTGIGLALPYFVLMELNLFTRLIADKEYSVAIDRQYSDIENRKSESSCRQALGSLRKQQYVMIDGRQRNATLIESDDIAPKLERLKAEIASAVGITTASGTAETIAGNVEK